MTRDDIIKALDWHPSVCQGPQSLLVRIERVVAQAEAQEREACAKVCEAESELRKDAAHKTHGNGSPAYGRQMSGVNAANNCAAAIRARGQQ